MFSHISSHQRILSSLTRPLFQYRWHGNKGDRSATSVTLIWHDSQNNQIAQVEAYPGQSLLDVAHEHEIPLEGACEGSLACSTCHVILQNSVYNSLPEPCDDEEDMLDLAFGLTSSSRLGCQIIVSPQLNNAIITLPAATRNFAVDGYVPKPH